MNTKLQDRPWWQSFVRVALGEAPRKLPARERSAYYVRSYLLMRTTVGVLGVLVPIIFIIGEAFFIPGPAGARGSISAYYHSPMQDFFVAGLSVIAFLLITYMGGHTRTRDFWYSAVGGAFLLGVVFFPTWRDAGPPYCGDASFPPGCSPVEQRLGEGTVAHIHQACAIGFILSLALMSFLFARDEIVVKHNTTMRNWQIAFGVAILVFGLWAVAGPAVAGLTALYIGEVGAIWSFALSWLFKGYTVAELARRPSARLEPPADGADSPRSVPAA